MYVSAIEYSVDYSALSSLLYIADMPVAPLNIGTTPIGVASGWSIPQNAYEPLLVMKLFVQWLCDDCDEERPANQAIVVRPGPTALSGRVQAVRWPDNVIVPGLGMTSTVCRRLIPVQETTWGQIKSLYN